MELKKKILHLSTVHNRYDTRIFYNMCQSLSSSFDVSLYVLDGKDNECINNISIKSLGTAQTKLRRLIMSFLYVPFKMLFTNFDLYHLHDPELYFCGIILRICKKNVIIDVHENYTEDLKNKNWIYPFFRKIILTLYKEISTLAFNFSNAVIAVTDEIGKSLDTNFILVRNFPRENRIASSIREKKVYDFCYVGSLSLRRGLDVILDVSLKSKSNLLLIGNFASDIDEQYFVDNKHQYARHIGFVKPEEVTAHISQCSVGLHLIKDDLNLLRGFHLKY